MLVSVLPINISKWKPCRRCFNWRKGTGCCWALMLVLFVVGIMNVFWVAVNAGLLLLEKTVPRGEWRARTSGAGLAVRGVSLM